MGRDKKKRKRRRSRSRSDSPKPNRRKRNRDIRREKEAAELKRKSEKNRSRSRSRSKERSRHKKKKRRKYSSSEKSTSEYSSGSLYFSRSPSPLKTEGTKTEIIASDQLHTNGTTVKSNNDPSTQKPDTNTQTKTENFTAASVEEQALERKKRIEASRKTKSSSTLSKKKNKNWTLDNESEDDEKSVPIDQSNVDKLTAMKEKLDKNLPKQETENKLDKMTKKEEKTDQNQHEEKFDQEDVDPLDAFMAELKGASTQDYNRSKKKKKWKKKNEKEKKNENADKNDENIKSENQKSEQQTDKPILKQEIETKILPQPRKKFSRVLVVKKKEETDDQINKRKGEIVETNADALEYDSEDHEDDLDKKYKARLEAKAKAERRLLDPTKKIDHKEIDYQPFEKKFYVEVPELKNLTSEQVKLLRISMENIKVRGKNVETPIMHWSQCGLRQSMLNILKREKFDNPTPIQAQAIPSIMSGRDVIGIAKTGSGKTLAFLLPLVRHIQHQKPLNDTDGPMAIILTPTRELALQITKDAKMFCNKINLRVACVYGGTAISEQIGELKRGAEVVVCTPGRMIDMLAVSNGKVTNLRRCTMIVLDEADRMFDLGFAPQVSHIMDQVRPDRQTVLFSATFPRDMEVLARKILNNSIVEIAVGGKSVVSDVIEQNVAILEEDNKKLKLLELLGIFHEKGSTIVFVHKQEVADELQVTLMRSGYTCLALHGGIDQYDRDSVITDFKNGVTKILVATSVAARGLDVKDLILVVNYDTPNHYEDYVHRVGRTGRAGQSGHAWTFLAHDDAKYAGDIVKAFELAKKTVPDNLSKFWEDYKTDYKKRTGKNPRTFSGFIGRGFKFDQDEENKIKEQRQMQKAALGVDEDDSVAKTALNTTQDIDKQIEEKFNIRKRIRTKEHYAPLPMANIAEKKAMEARALPTSEGVDLLKMTAIEKAKSINARLKMKTSKAETTAKKVVRGKGYGTITAATPLSAKQIAEQMANKLNNKLNYSKDQTYAQKAQKEQADNDGNTFVSQYEEALEINDFPQTVRFKCCQRDFINRLIDTTECRVTIRGRYYEEDEPEPQNEEDDPRLFMEIIGDTEMQVSACRAEITRMVKEELLKISSKPLSNISKSRYTVVPK